MTEFGKRPLADSERHEEESEPQEWQHHHGTGTPDHTHPEIGMPPRCRTTKDPRRNSGASAVLETMTPTPLEQRTR